MGKGYQLFANLLTVEIKRYKIMATWLKLCVLVVLIVAMVEAQLKIAKSPLRRDSASAYAPPYSASQKTAAAAPSYASGPSYAGGRVKIQVYRGPNKQGGKGGYDDGAFAPWGFYVTQPEDNKANYGR